MGHLRLSRWLGTFLRGGVLRARVHPPSGYFHSPVVYSERPSSPVRRVGGRRAMSSPLLDRKDTHFILWRPGAQEPPPKLVIGVGVFKVGSPAVLAEERAIPMVPVGESGDLWE